MPIQFSTVFFPPIDLRSMIFVYSGVCKAKGLQSMRISIIQTTWRERRQEQSCRGRLALLSRKFSTFLLKMLLYTPRTVNWNYHWIVQQPRWRRIFVESVSLRNRVDCRFCYWSLLRCTRATGLHDSPAHVYACYIIWLSRIYLWFTALFCNVWGAGLCRFL